eukprot:291456-Prorocentrum_minimum.AAC.2
MENLNENAAFDVDGDGHASASEGGRTPPQPQSRSSLDQGGGVGGGRLDEMSAKRGNDHRSEELVVMAAGKRKPSGKSASGPAESPEIQVRNNELYENDVGDDSRMPYEDEIAQQYLQE